MKKNGQATAYHKTDVETAGNIIALNYCTYYSDNGTVKQREN